MKTLDAIKAFGGAVPLSAGLGISPSAVYQWGDEVPVLRVYQIELILLKRMAGGRDTTALLDTGEPGGKEEQSAAPASTENNVVTQV